ncbi:MAG: hypothetical protein U9Q83_01730 [Bacteroidota bacterium]|nr:hypothetical protein [Bacteroidota bacterium]
MKKTILFILLIASSLSFVFAQKSSEYRFFGVKFSAINNFSFGHKTNNYVFIDSPYGDLLKENNSVISYTPGGSFSIIYNTDNANDKQGLSFGVNIQNYGFKNLYKSTTSNFTITDEYRVTTIGVPIYFKYWPSNIYKEQLYATFGVQLNYYMSVYNYQTANWSRTMPGCDPLVNDCDLVQYVNKMSAAKTKKFSLAATLGFNYNIYFINFQLLSPNFVNKKYTVTIEEGTITPYENINFMNSFYVETGINIPLTRWLTARDWTAEKIRRFISGSK